jgi:hypothetical protein
MAAARNCPNQSHQDPASGLFFDAAPSGFFLFGYRKGEMAGFRAKSPANIVYKIRWIFQEILKETVAAVHDE